MTEETINVWHDHALPNDSFNVENAIITMTSHRTSYLIDPQYQARSWLVEFLKIKPE